MRVRNVVIGMALFASLSACEPTAPLIEQATPNVISLSYEAYGSAPTITPAALDLAIEHCKKRGLFANYRGANSPNPFSAREVHTFVCERTKADDNAVIIAQNQQYAASAAATAAAMGALGDAFSSPQPSYTQCSTVGFQTNCTTY